MRRAARCLVGLAVALASAAPASAGWWEVWQADQRLDLESARELALAAIADDPAGADGVAAAMWWLANIDNLPAPEEPLALVASERDPELGFVMARIEAELKAAPPDGALGEATVAGPFGVLSTLDLERGVVPPDDGLPPVGTRWHDTASPFRLPFGSVDGFYGPPMAMSVDGVYLAAWTIAVEAEVEGWLVVEAQGSFNLELDGKRADSRRDCGVSDPVANWYRIRLAAGTHRLRLEIASPGSPRVRVSLLDERGSALGGLRTINDVPAPGSSSSRLEIARPPAARRLTESAKGAAATVPELLLAARLAAGAGDRELEYHFVERALEAEPQDPWAALALATWLFTDEGGAGAGERARRLTQLVRAAGPIPASRLIERGLAVREGRSEDAERILDALMAEHGDDVRVLKASVREAVRKGWAREGEDDLLQLESALPGARSVAGLRLEVLSALERWGERSRLLQALAAAEPVDARWIGDLASSCLVEDAIGAIERVRAAASNPDVDIQLIRLHLENGDVTAGRTALDEARRRWGDLGQLDQLALIAAAGDDEAAATALEQALGRHPSNLQLLSLAWRAGDTPFFEPFQVEARDFAATYRELGRDVDVVLLLDQAVERIFADGSSLYYYHGLSRANTPVGVRRASVLQPLPDAHLLKVRILKPDGSVVVPSELREGNGFIALEGVEPGDLVEEEYVAEVAATGASRHGHLPPYLYRFADPDRAFGLSEYVLLVPPEVDLQVDGNFVGLEREEGEWDGLRRLSWRAEGVPPMAAEPFSPSPQELMPWLNYGFGVTWQDVGDIIRDRVLAALRTSPELRAWGSSVLEGETAEARLQSMMAALVDTVEAGDREIDLGSTVAESFARRRGNRLGIVAAVLAEAGWSVDLVLTRSWNERGRHLQVPTLDAFPAALLRVSDGADEFWLDVREGRRGVGHISPFFQGADGLQLPLSEPQRPVALLDRLPRFDNPDLVEEVSVRAEVAASGDARIRFRMPLRGGQAEDLVQRVESVPDEQAGMIYRQMAASLFPGADEVRGAVERTGSGAVIELELVAPRACEPDGAEMVCRSLVLSNPLVPVLAALPERQNPLLLRIPIRRRLELELVPPPGWRVGERPPRLLETGWGSVNERVAASAGGLRSVLEIELAAQTVAPDDYPAFARFCQAVDELATRPPRLQPLRSD